MMKTTAFVFGLMAVFSVAQAEEKKKIYKYTDENGVTHYTETKPNDNYEEADLPALSVVPSTPVNNSPNYNSGADADQQPEDSSVVDEFTLVEPVSNQNIWGTGGKLTAKVKALTPAQQEQYQVQFVIDGKKHQPADASTQIFEGIYRGQHTVQALLINRFNDKVEKKSKQVTFYMHQNSKK